MNENDKDKDQQDFRPEVTALTMVSPDDEADGSSVASDTTGADASMTGADASSSGTPDGQNGKKEEGPDATMVMTSPPGSRPAVDKTVPMKTMPVSSASRTGLYEPQPGDRIDRYVIVKKLGQGGMGSVYLARHETLGVLRALKVLSGVLYQRGGEFVKRFMQEARIACSISNPNIVNVLDVGEDPERSFCWIVMEYVDGGTIRDVLRKIPHLGELHALAITRAAAEALKAAAEQKIVHRDIKPDNIMLTRKGEVKLADLGIAKNTDENVQLTRSHVMMGTPAYLAPEQAQDAHGVDVRADIYSLGATLYEMLTGEIPYPGKSTFDILKKMASDPVPDPRAKVETISAPTARLVMRMLAKQAKQRPQSAVELLKDIAGLNLFPKDFDSSSGIRDLLEQSGSGSYAPDSVTPTVSGTASIRMVRQVLLRVELALRNIPLFDSWFSFCHRRPVTARVILLIVFLLLIAVPAAFLFLQPSENSDSGRASEKPGKAVAKTKPLDLSPGPAAPEAVTDAGDGRKVPDVTTPSAEAAVTEAVSSAEKKADEEKIHLQKQAEEEKRLAEEKKRAEEEKIRLQKQAEEKRLAEEKKRAEEEKIRLQKKMDEEKRIAEELRRKTEQEARKQEQQAIAKKTAEPKKADLFVEVSPAGALAVLRDDQDKVVDEKVIPQDGKVRFQAPEGQYKLKVSFPGFQTVERTVPVSENRTISCVRIELARDMAVCTLNFYGVPKLLDYLRKTGLEARMDDGDWFQIKEFPFKLELSRAQHTIELREKGVLPLRQVLEISPDQERVSCDLYLRGKEAELTITTQIAGNIEMNTSGIWRPLSSPVSVKPFRAFDFRWRAAGGKEHVVSIPELDPGASYPIVLEEQEKADRPAAAEYAEAEKLLAEKEYRAASEKLKIAAEKGNADAVFRLAQMDEEGKGRWFPSDSDALAGYQKIAPAPHNHRDAQYKLGEFYENGRGGLDRDIRTALKWYKLAAAQRQRDALYRLGMACKNGEGNEPVDYVRMVEYFTQSAEQGHPEAQYQLGYCYENGLGVPINVKQAKFWYGKASAQGHRVAQRRVEALETIK
ncbi:MAG: protein kinase [Lentisphaeria bacterium]|nr:protein kinase [Lentisphaeria bacterium]